MAILGSSTGKKRVMVGMAVVIVALAGAFLTMSHVSSNRAKTSEEIALTVVKAIHSSNPKLFQRLFSKDTCDKSGFVYLVAQEVREYGPVKEVALMSNDRMLPGFDGKGLSGGPRRGLSSWKVVAERGKYVLGIQVEDGNLVGCNVNLPGGGIVTGSM